MVVKNTSKNRTLKYRIPVFLFTLCQRVQRKFATLSRNLKDYHKVLFRDAGWLWSMVPSIYWRSCSTCSDKRRVKTVQRFPIDDVFKTINECSNYTVSIARFISMTMVCGSIVFWFAIAYPVVLCPQSELHKTTDDRKPCSFPGELNPELVHKSRPFQSNLQCKRKFWLKYGYTKTTSH